MVTHTRRAGEEEGSHNDRRVDVLNQHEVRLSILEAHHQESIVTRQAHSKAIDELNDALHETASALKDGIRDIASKFDALMAQIKIGFLIITGGSTLFVTLFGAFYVYNEKLDDRYVKNYQTVKEQLQTTAKSIDIVEDKGELMSKKIEDTQTDIDKLQNKKVIKASK